MARALIGPPAGGGLYHRFGFRGPFILGIIVTAFDLVGRLLIIEKADADAYREESIVGMSSVDKEETDQPGKFVGKPREAPPVPAVTQLSTISSIDDTVTVMPTGSPATEAPLSDTSAEDATGSLTLFGVLWKLAKSPRAVAVMISTLVYG